MLFFLSAALASPLHDDLVGAGRPSGPWRCAQAMNGLSIGTGAVVATIGVVAVATAPPPGTVQDDPGGPGTLLIVSGVLAGGTFLGVAQAGALCAYAARPPTGPGGGWGIAAMATGGASLVAIGVAVAGVGNPAMDAALGLAGASTVFTRVQMCRNRAALERGLSKEPVARFPCVRAAVAPIDGVPVVMLSGGF